MAVALIAPALSPWLGGLIVDNASWRWIFHSNIPLALAAAALGLGARHPVRAPAASGPQGAGADQHRAGQPADRHVALWRRPEHDAGLDCLATGAASAFAYVLHYRGSTHAIVELKLLGSPRLRLSVAVYHAIPGVFTGVNLLNIFYLQDVLGMSARATACS